MIKRSCRYCEAKVETIEYKDDRDIRRAVNERGKIVPRRISGTCAKHQRKIAQAIKRARFLAILPHVADNIR